MISHLTFSELEKFLAEFGAKLLIWSGPDAAKNFAGSGGLNGLPEARELTVETWLALREKAPGWRQYLVEISHLHEDAAGVGYQDTLSAALDDAWLGLMTILPEHLQTQP